MALWSKHCQVTPWHEAWALRHIRITNTRKNDSLYFEGVLDRSVYIVAKGMLARVQYDQNTGRRHILTVAVPGMALMTTFHLYSHTPSKGDIIVLRANTQVIQISYQELKSLKQQEPDIDTLIDVLGNKKKKQLAALRGVTLGAKPYISCLLFLEEMPDLRDALTLQEIADLLGISLSTVKRAYKKWLKS